MYKFQPGSFSDISSTEVGLELWSFLNSESSIIRLETATELRRPALEALQTQLVEKFGPTIKVDRWKQMTGRMVRQIMEHHGYSLDQTGVRIRDGVLFTSAARYTKPNLTKA